MTDVVLDKIVFHAKEALNMSDVALSNHVILPVMNGARPMAFLGTIPANEDEMKRARRKLKKAAAGKPVTPFVLDRGDGVAIFGYAQEPWVVETLAWLHATTTMEDFNYHAVMGLLLGYSPREIGRFEKRRMEARECSDDAVDEMSIRIIPLSNMSLEDMVEEGLITAEDAEAERAVLKRIRENRMRLHEMAKRIDDDETRAIAMMGGR